MPNNNINYKVSSRKFMNQYLQKERKLRSFMDMEDKYLNYYGLNKIPLNNQNMRIHPCSYSILACRDNT